MKNMTLTKTQSAIALALLASGFAAYAATPQHPDVPTRASNTESIVNTRHNLTQSFLGGASVKMDDYRNNYQEVCVYCHTPHAANTTIAAPLWNRTNKATTYNTYNSSTLTQKVSQPGPNSLSCLSCHDGTVAIDSIINMPGSGGYDSRQMTTVNKDFLDQWVNAGNFYSSSHLTLDSNGGTSGCTQCHSTNGFSPNATDFTAFVIGTDLRNDHPVGIKYPSTKGPPDDDFNKYTGEYKNIAFFDENSDGSLSKNEIRMYNTGDGYEVECASCHDPHGVPSSRPGAKIGEFTKSFLRKDNNESKVCTTCHVK